MLSVSITHARRLPEHNHSTPCGTCTHAFDLCTHASDLCAHVFTSTCHSPPNTLRVRAAAICVSLSCTHVEVQSDKLLATKRKAMHASIFPHEVLTGKEVYAGASTYKQDHGSTSITDKTCLKNIISHSLMTVLKIPSQKSIRALCH